MDGRIVSYSYMVVYRFDGLAYLPKNKMSCICKVYLMYLPRVCLMFSEQFTSCLPAPPRPASLPLKVGSGDLHGGFEKLQRSSTI